MKFLLRKIKIIYFLKSIFSPVNIDERNIIFKNFFKYFYICFLRKKKTKYCCFVSKFRMELFQHSY